MQIRVLSIHRGHELCWNAQQILHETCRKEITATLSTADIFMLESYANAAQGLNAL